MRQTHQVAAIILAAGQSKRSGPVNKLLAPMDGKPMIAHVVEAVAASRAHPVVVVTGHQDDALRTGLAGDNVAFAHNAEFATGMGGSIGCGVRALPETADGALICLGDMPHVTADTLNALIAAYERDGAKDICVPCHGGRRGNPVLFGRRRFEALKEISGDRGAKGVIAEFSDAVQEVDVDDEGIFIDHDRVTA